MSMPGDSYNRGGFIAFVFSMIFSLTFFIYVGLIHPGIDLGEVPEAAQDESMRLAGDGSGEQGQAVAANFNAAEVAEPWVSSPDLVRHGGKVYQANCAACHGAKGQGDGPAGQALMPKPRNLVQGGWRKGGSSKALYLTLVNGIAGGSMASFKHLPKNDRWALVHFIRSITKDKPADDATALKKFAMSAE